MLPMIIGLVVFFTIHLIPTNPELRKGLVARYGESAYKIGFSIISLIAFVVIVLGYHKLQMMPGKNPLLWDPPMALRHATYLLMFASIILLVAAYIPSKLRDIVKHPMLGAIKFWAFGHLLVNGDMGSIVLFGSFLAWAIYDRISLKNREGGRGPLGDKPGTLAGDAAVIAVGAALYLGIVYWGHAALIGVPVMP
jgi:uncharacterized membrane protein